MKYQNITHDDLLNGDGLRVVLWVSGCNHKCKECQNPITWNPEVGVNFDIEAKNEIFNDLKKDYISGITFSGGDPLHPANINEITDLAKEIKNLYPEKTIWLYTGSKWDEIKHLEIIQFLDVLIDGEFEVDKKDVQLYWRGSSNQNVIDAKESLKQQKIVLHCK